MVKNPVENIKVGQFTLLDAGLVAASKLGSDMVLSKLVGNSSYKSGLIKLGGAVVVDFALRKYGGRTVATGVGLDGMEDIMIAAKRQFIGAGSGDSAAQGEVTL